MATVTNTGKKDAKGRTIYKGPRGGEFVKTSSGSRVRPAIGRLGKKQLEEKARALSAKRMNLERKARNLSAKRANLEEREARAAANDVMRRLDAIVAKKSRNVKTMA